jgi:hypothetical protein
MLVSLYLEIELILTQDRGTVCAKHTIGPEIILGAPDGTPRYVAQVDARISLFGYIANLEGR